MNRHPPPIAPFNRIGKLLGCAAVLCCSMALPTSAQPVADEPAQPSLLDRIRALPQEDRVPDALIEEVAVLTLRTVKATITEGLNASEDSLNILIELHRLLGERNDLRAQLLALRIVVMVDYVVMNEFYRRWLVHIEHPHNPSFAPAGYSTGSATKLLKRNEMTDLSARADAAMKMAGPIGKLLTQAGLDGEGLLKDGLPNTLRGDISTRIRASVLMPALPAVDLKELHLGDLYLAAVVDCHRTQWRVRLLMTVLNQPSDQLPRSTEASWKVIEQQMPVKRRDILLGSPVAPRHLGSFIADHAGVNAENFRRQASVLLAPFSKDWAEIPPLESKENRDVFKMLRWGAIVNHE